MNPDALATGARAAALVTQMAVTTVLGGGIGRVLDGRLGTEPWLLVTGFVFGFAVGTAAMLKGLLGRQRADDDEPPHPPE